jgi:hypothetical protein
MTLFLFGLVLLIVGILVGRRPSPLTIYANYLRLGGL